MGDVVLIYEKLLKFILDKPQRYIRQLLSDSSNRLLTSQARQAACIPAGLCYYYGLQTAQNISAARRCFEFAKSLSNDDTKLLTGWLAATKTWIKGHAELAIEERGFACFLVDNPEKTFSLSHLLAAFEKFVYHHVFTETRYPFISTYNKLQIVLSRQLVAEAALACLDLSHGSPAAQDVACLALQAVSIYRQPVNVFELIVGELHLYGVRTISVRHASVYFRSLQIPSNFVDVDDEIQIRKLALGEVEPFLRDDPSCRYLDNYLQFQKPAGDAKFRGRLEAARIDYSAPFKNPSLKAISWIARAAEHGEMQATFIQGIFHQMNGHAAEAFQCYSCSTRSSTETLPEPGFAEGYRALSACYQSGIGTDQDSQLALEMMALYCVASKIGHMKGAATPAASLSQHFMVLRNFYATYHKLVIDEKLSFEEFLDEFSAMSASHEAAAADICALANYLLALEFYDRYNGLSEHQPYALKIVRSPGSRPLQSALNYLLKAEKHNSDAKAFLHAELNPAVPTDPKVSARTTVINTRV